MVRAFSVFIYNTPELLTRSRRGGRRSHSGGFLGGARGYSVKNTLRIFEQMRLSTHSIN